MRYQAIIFDLDGTLRVSRPRFMDALYDCARSLGLPVDRDAWHRAERWVHYYWARSPELQYDLDEHGDEALWLRFIHRLLHKAGHKATLEEAQQLVNTFAETYHPESVLTPGVHETLQVLRPRGVTLGILSNRRDPFVEELENLGIHGYFDFVLAAGEVGIWKPDPGIFHAALERAGNVPPERALYVGDNYYADVQGARAAGMDVVLVNDRGIFEDADCPTVKDLRELLTLIDT